MSFRGNLTDSRLTDLLQMIATTGKSGKLRLTRRDAEGIIVFRQGKIIYAATTSLRATLGSALVAEGLIDEEQLSRALDRQHRSSRDRRLGSILVESGALDQETLDRVIAEQAQRVIAELIRWPSGFFKFELLEIPDRGEVEVDAKELLLDQGLSPEHVLLNIATRLDELEEQQRRGAPSKPAPGKLEKRRHLASLRELMAEIRSPEFTGEFNHQVLSFARRFVERGALFLVHRHLFSSVGTFGAEGKKSDGHHGHRELQVPLDKDSLLSETLERMETCHGPLAETEGNRLLLEELGGGMPTEAVGLPLTVNGRVMLVFYGDNWPGGQPITGIEDLELMLLQVGLAMEKTFLEKRISHFEKLRWGRATPTVSDAPPD